MSDDPLLSTGSKYASVPLVVALLVVAGGGGWMAGRVGGSAERDRRVAAARDQGVAEAQAAYANGFAAGEAAAKAASVAPSPVVPAMPPAPAADEPEEKPAEPAGMVVPVEKPAVLRVNTIPLGEVWVSESQGAARPVGRADVTGAFSLETLPAGDYRLEVRHADYPRMEAPVSVTLSAGESLEKVVVPPSHPGSLMIFADDGAPLYVDGKKIGLGGTALLGKVPTRRDLLVTLGEPGKETRRVVVRLEPKETRAIDLRTAAAIAEKSAQEKAAAVAAANALTPGALAVRVVSSDPETGIVAFSRSGGGAAPMSVGDEGRFRAPAATKTVKVKCVRVFAGVSVCRGEVFDVAGSATSGELIP